MCSDFSHSKIGVKFCESQKMHKLRGKTRDILCDKGHRKAFYNKIFKNSCNETQLCYFMQISPGNIYGICTSIAPRLSV